MATKSSRDRALLQFFVVVVFLFFAGGFLSIVRASESDEVEKSLKHVQQISTSNQQLASKELEELQAQQDKFTPAQLLHFRLIKASLLALFGKHQEHISFINGFLNSEDEANTKSKFLYQLTISYLALGEYESALNTMNQGIAILPKVTDAIAQIDTLQSAIDLHNSIHAYQESLEYAQRMFDIQGSKLDISAAKCIASADRADIYVMLKQSSVANEHIKTAVEACDAINWHYISLIVESIGAIDLIENHHYQNGIDAGLTALKAFPESILNTKDATRLEESLATAYLHRGKLEEAEHFALMAYKTADSQKLAQQTEKSLETLALIKRAQGQYASALDYAEKAIEKKNALLDEELQKNIAYQRVKFNVQDQSNQVTMLERQNKILAIEKQLEKKNSENLTLIIALAFIVSAALGLYVWKVTLQKNVFRIKTQIDALTRISTRDHFLSCTEDIVEAHNQFVSLILFDMDFFKRINDNHGHAVGDWVLLAVCQTVSTQLRSGDLFGRLGGEEFAICLPDTDVTTAWQIAQRCRAAIEKINTEPSGVQFPLSASFGIAYLGLNDDRNFPALLEAADKALYQAKAEGRNCVVVSKSMGLPETPTPTTKANESSSIAA